MGIPWEEIRTKYITGTQSYASLAAEYSLRRDVIGRRGKQEAWVEQRRQYADKLHTKTLEAAADTAANQLARIKGTVDKLVQQLEMTLDAGIEGKVPMNPASAEHLANAVKTTISMMRELYDIPTPAEAEARTIARERLKLDKERIHPDTDNVLTVRLSPELEEIAGWQS